MVARGCLLALKVLEWSLDLRILTTVSQDTRNPRCPRRSPLRREPLMVQDRRFARSDLSPLRWQRVGLPSLTNNPGAVRRPLPPLRSARRGRVAAWSLKTLLLRKLCRRPSFC